MWSSYQQLISMGLTQAPGYFKAVDIEPKVDSIVITLLSKNQ